MHYIGLDIGGTTIKAGLVNETGKVLASQRVPTSVNDLNDFLSELTALIRDFQKFATVEGIGIGVPGLRSSRTHVIETSPNIPCLKNVNLEERMADQIHLRVVSENDANAGAWAEFVCGAGIGVQHMAYLTLGTGLGSGLILNGSLYTGTSGYGGEFGHTVIQASPYGPENGRLCACGNRGCMETFVSAAGIIRSAEERGMQGQLTPEIIYEAACRGDAAAREVFKDTGHYLGIACANLMNLLNLERIVIGGGLMASRDLLLRPAVSTAEQYAFPASFRDCQIVQSSLWPDAGMIGAAMLARDR